MHCSITISGKSRPCRAFPPLALRLSRTVALIVLLVVPSVRTQTSNSTGTNLTRLTEAAKAISQGDLSTAESLLNSVLAASPTDADALNLLGVVRAQ